MFKRASVASVVSDCATIPTRPRPPRPLVMNEWWWWWMRTLLVWNVYKWGFKILSFPRLWRHFFKLKKSDLVWQFLSFRAKTLTRSGHFFMFEKSEIFWRTTKNENPFTICHVWNRENLEVRWAGKQRASCVWGETVCTWNTSQTWIHILYLYEALKYLNVSK